MNKPNSLLPPVPEAAEPEVIDPEVAEGADPETAATEAGLVAIVV